jgi:hypothetical protein
MAAPQHNGPVAWISEFTNQVTITNITAYLAANGVTVHDTDNTVWWACSIAREMLNCIDESGGSDNPSTAAHYGPIRQDRQIPCTDDSLNRTREWYESEVQTRGVLLSEVPPITLSSQARIKDDTFL